MDSLRTQHQRLHAADVLVVLERRHDSFEMQLIGHRDDHDVARRHAADQLFVEFGLRLIARLRVAAKSGPGNASRKRF